MDVLPKLSTDLTVSERHNWEVLKIPIRARVLVVVKNFGGSDLNLNRDPVNCDKGFGWGGFGDFDARGWVVVPYITCPVRNPCDHIRVREDSLVSCFEQGLKRLRRALSSYR